jgi:signal peptidase II
MRYGEGIYLFGDSDFLVIRFIENPGMAFGFEFGGIAGKLALSVFRLLASGAIVYALWKLVKTKAPKGLITCVALILAGAVGNILDSMFFGLIFDKGLVDGVGYSGLAQLTKFGLGYASFLQGNVVDMISFSIFPPIFNIADAAISLGVIWIILFQRKYFPKEEKEIEVVGDALDSDATEEVTAEIE